MRSLFQAGILGVLLAHPASSRAEETAPVAVAVPVAVPAADPAADVQLRAPETLFERPAWARFASGRGAGLFAASGTLLPLASDGEAGKNHALRNADALLTVTLLTTGLKTLTHAERPDGSDFRSFPSGHASASFALAAMQSHFHPSQALLWYGGATVISASRVKLRRHYKRDVLVGALLGIAVARLEIASPRGLLLRPFIRRDEPNRGVSNLSFSRVF